MSKNEIPTLVHSFRRVSSEKQKKEGYSLAIQKKQNEARAEADSLVIHRDWELDETATRGLAKTRKQFDEFFDSIQNQKFYHIILCEKLDRLFRNEYDKFQMRKLIKNGIAEIRTERPRDVFDSSAGAFKKLSYNIMGDIAEFYSDYLKEERDKSIKEKLERGEFPGQPPNGYEPKPRTKGSPPKLVQNNQAPLVKKFLEIFNTAKYSPAEMVEKAKHLGLKSKHGNPLTLASVKYMLRNKFYTGSFDFPDPSDGELKEWKSTNYEPLISRKLWQRNQQILDKRIVTYSKRVGEEYRYKGLIYCAKCQRVLMAEPGERTGYYAKKKKKEVDYKHLYYHCTRGHMTLLNGTKEKCDLNWFREEEIDKQILEQIELLEFNNKMWEDVKKKLFDVEGTRQITYEIQRLRAEETRLENDLEHLYEDYRKGVVDEKFFTDTQDKTRARQEEIKGRLEELEEDKEFWEEKVSKLVHIIDGIKNFKEKFLEFDDEKKAQMLRLMSDKITANSAKLEIKGRTKTVRQITIHWNDEFEELFHAGVFKVMDEYRDKFRWPSPPKGGGIHPRLINKNLSDKNKCIDFLFSIIYLLFIS